MTMCKLVMLIRKNKGYCHQKGWANDCLNDDTEISL